jgi:hypothetical protein
MNPEPPSDAAMLAAQEYKTKAPIQWAPMSMMVKIPSRRSGRPSSRLDALFQYQDQFLRNELPTTTNTAPMMIDIAIGHDHYH